ncbi:MAG: DNA gyrase inhibitor YacG [Dissulfurimicrobium sp.]|uniref:DNA gyrase inhibitor YacG n=1 Tax=Dissulfurimicrobium sp. TaxID=2022436 RepID=UPI00404A5111
MNKLKNTFNCPICHKSVSHKDNPFRPFCSKRCKMIDMGAWLKGDYYIQGDYIGDRADQDSDESIKKGPDSDDDT